MAKSKSGKKLKLPKRIGGGKKKAERLGNYNVNALTAVPPDPVLRSTPLLSRFKSAARGWLVRYGERRVDRELEDFHNPPELRRGTWFGRRPRPDQPQVFR